MHDQWFNLWLYRGYSVLPVDNQTLHNASCEIVCNPSEFYKYYMCSWVYTDNSSCYIWMMKMWQVGVSYKALSCLLGKYQNIEVIVLSHTLWISSMGSCSLSLWLATVYRLYKVFLRVSCFTSIIWQCLLYCGYTVGWKCQGDYIVGE